MGDYTERFTEAWQLLGYKISANVAAEQNTGYFSLANFHRAVIIIHPVKLTNTLNVDIEEATTTGGAGAQAFDNSNKDITVGAADTLPNVIEIRTEECDVDDKYDCINVEVTPAGSAEYFVIEVWGMPRFRPAATTNLDSVTD